VEKSTTVDIASTNLIISLRPRLRGGNGMEINEKNNFRIFFPSLVWEF